MIATPNAPRPTCTWLAIGPKLLANARKLSQAWETLSSEALNGQLADIVKTAREIIAEAEGLKR